MADNIMKCPICGQETSGRFCESCGFEFHVLPEGVSEEVNKYENERVERHRKAFEGLQKLQELERKAKDLEEKLSESKNEVNASQSEISKQQVELEKQKTELEQRIAEIDQQKTEFERLHQESESKVKELEKQLTESKNAVNASQSEISKQQTEFEQQKKRLEQQETEIQNAQKTNADLRTKNEQLDSDLKKSQAEVSSLENQLEQAKKDGANAQLDGIVRIIKKNSSGGVVTECYLPVYKGLNTYGTKQDNRSNHHVIGIKRTPIKDEHFSVEKNGSGQMIVKPINGDLTCDGGPIPKTGLAVEIHHVISIGDTIEVRISLI